MPNYVRVRSLPVEYYVRGSVLGRLIVTELNTPERKVKTHVYAGGDLVAEQQLYDGCVEALV